VKPTSLDPAPMPRNLVLSRQALSDLGLANHPLIKAATADAEAARYAREQTYAGDYPSVSLEMRGTAGQDIAGTPGRDNELVGKVVVRWNLFDGLITRHRQLEASERLAQTLAERDDRARSVVEEINRALAAYQTGVVRLEALNRQAKSAREVVTAYEVEYTLAKRSLLDLLTAENTSFNARIQAISTEAVNLVSAYRLLAATGRILADLGIVPPPEGLEPAPITTLSDSTRLFFLEPLR
jgi:adhesin transport system outer membrane protein